MFMTNKEKIKACIFRADAGRASSCKACKERDICKPEEVLKEQDAAEDQEWGSWEERMKGDKNE